MWICRECDTKNQDTDFYCACCGAKNPKPAAPRPARTPSQNDQRPAEPRPASGSAAKPAPAPEAKSSALPEDFPARQKTKIPVALILILIGILFLGWKMFQNNHSSETEYTSYSVKYDKVYVDVVKIDPINFHAWLSNEKDPTYVVCRCTRKDGSTFDMFITTSEYKRKFDKGISFKRIGNSFGTLETGETLSFSPAIRIHGEVYDGSFLYGDNAAKYNINTVLQYKSCDK